MTQQSLSVDDIDNLGKAVATLARELWIVKDRFMILEAVLEKHGINAAHEIDALTPDSKLAERLAASREELIENLMQALNPKPGSEASLSGRIKPGFDVDADED